MNHTTNQKNRFWTFCFSLVPGAGPMYFGLYRTGLSLMLLCCAVIAVAWVLDLFPLLLLCLVLWFYSFFLTHNLRSLPPEQFWQMEDRWLWAGFTGKFRWDRSLKAVLAVALIAVGAQQLWRTFYWVMADLFPYSSGLREFIYNLPRAVIAVLIILAGIWLIRGGKREYEAEEARPEEPPVYDAPVTYVSEFADAPHAPDVPSAADAPNVTDAPNITDAPKFSDTEGEEDGHANP
ncbi:MAG: hypothetical protein IJ751_06745 [Oscillospiraceae bacterium]|nr:hypothetical protein [Oscillospiraceae bacterium]